MSISRGSPTPFLITERTNGMYQDVAKPVPLPNIAVSNERPTTTEKDRKEQFNKELRVTKEIADKRRRKKRNMNGKNNIGDKFNNDRARKELLYRCEKNGVLLVVTCIIVLIVSIPFVLIKRKRDYKDKMFIKDPSMGMSDSSTNVVQSNLVQPTIQAPIVRPINTINEHPTITPSNNISTTTPLI